MTGPYYDALETRDPAEREQALFRGLPDQIEHARTNTKAFADALRDIAPESINSRESLAELPVVRKPELLAKQQEDRPFGGFVVDQAENLGRVFGSPGPIYEPEQLTKDYWRIARALFAAGVRSGDLVHNAFSYHFTPAGSMIEGGAHAIGCTVFPAGVGQTELQVQAIRDLRSTAYAGTPSFLKIILDKAAELGADVSSLTKGLVSGEALPPSLRGELAERGIDVAQCYATADVGLIAYESPAREGMIIDEGIIVEIVRPGTGEPLPEGEVGEVVVTTFNPVYPLVRFGTGDLSAVMSGPSPCGRTHTRIKGWMGRADQTTKVKGMFVHPSQVAEVVKRHTEIVRARLVVDNNEGRDVMTLHCEASRSDEDLAQAIAESIREVCKLRGDVALVGEGELPNDGKVIDDVRSYE